VEHDVLLFLLGLAILLGGARVLGEGCRKLGVPAVTGEILAGVLLGKTVLGRFSPGGFAWLFPDGPARTMLTAYTTVAVMLLLVVAGLEIDLTVVRKSGRVVVLTSALGVVVPFALGYATSHLLPDAALPDPSRRALHAAFLGIALSISALPVIAKTLLDLGLLKTDLGLTILSAAVFDDLAGWTGFSVLSQQFHRHGEGPGIGVSVLLTAAFVVGTLVVVRPLADRLLGWLQGPDEAATGRALSMIMVLALLGASVTQALGMHPVFGGFVMGVAIGDSRRLREHTRQILSDFVTNVFTPVFFATMALRYDFVSAFDLRLVALVIGIACVAKVAGCAVGARLAGVAWREAAAIGFGMNSRGAMEILLAVLALQAGIIGEKLFVALVVMALVTSLISGPALNRLVRAASSPVAALLRAGEILLDAPAPGRPELLEAMAAGLAARAGRPGDAARFMAKVLDREQLASTGVGDGVAFPHAEIDGLEAPLLAFARPERGLDFDAPDGQPVRLVFLLLLPPRDYDRQLQLLSAMARLLTQEAVRRALLRAGTAREVLALLDDAGRTPVPGSAPASARAGRLAQ
jgi:Kef-type K+ transport system membrane component KefB/mannitol/fructose-specific phosphotransferase system IIA component (Ntr-type)